MPRCGHRAVVAVLMVTLFTTMAACGEADPAPATTEQTASSLPPQPAATSAATSTTEAATTTTTAPATTTTTSPLLEQAEAGAPMGMIRFGEEGLVVAPFEGETVTIPGDRYYPQVWQAEPDGIGGIVYQPMEVHPSWPQGTIFRLAPDAMSPEPVFIPTRDTRTELYGVVRHNGEPSLLLGHQTIHSHESTTLLVVPFSPEAPRKILMTMPGLVDHVSYGGGMFVAAVPTSASCTALEFFDHDGDQIDAPPQIGAQQGCGESYLSTPHLAADGSLLVYRSGEHIQLHSLTTGDRWEMEGYVVDYDGYSTFVSIGPSPPEAWLVKVGSDGFGERTPIEDPGWARLYSHPIEVATGATLDLGEPYVECSTTGLEFNPPPADLPAAVAAKRDAIARAAGSCDFVELGALAEPHDGFEFFTSCCAFRMGIEDDPVRFWLIGETANTEEMVQLLRLLQMEPGRIDGGWVWPAAVVQDESEIDWPALEELFAGVHEVMYEVSRDRGYYNGFIVEIMDSGRWRMFKQVIDPPIAG